MGRTFELSRATWATLGLLLVANLLLFLLFLPREPAPDAAEEDAPPLADDLKLIREIDPAQRHAMASQPAPSESRQLPQLVEPEPRECRAWGPFTSLEALEAVSVRIRELGEILEIRPSEVRSAPDYLVYLDSDNNLDNARRLLKELESQSFDAYVIAGGEFVNMVSAGVFSSEERALRQVETLTDLGYAPAVEALERIQTVHHLIARVPAGFTVAGMASEPCAAIAPAR